MTESEKKNRVRNSITQIGVQKFLDDCFTENTASLPIKSYLTKPFELYITEDYDYDMASRYYESNNVEAAGCSSFFVMKDGKPFTGRHLDWYYNDFLIGYVYSEKTSKRYKSHGICGVNRETRLSDFQLQGLKISPYHMLDGVNECGLYINTNVVPKTSNSYKGTNSGKYRVPCYMVARWVLDNCSSVEDAVNKLTGDISIWTPEHNEYEYHWLLADESGAHTIIEITDGKIHTSDREVMTNFRLTWEGLDDTSVETMRATCEDYACGLERYMTIKSMKDTASVQDTIEAAKYTNAYTLEGEDIWWTEFVGKGEYKGIVVDNKATNPHPESDEMFNAVRDAFVEAYRTRQIEDYDDPSKLHTWESVHTSIYDLQERKLLLYIREDFNNQIEYTL